MKTFVVIGASSGIGKEVTRQLLAKGHRVIGTYYKGSVEGLIRSLAAELTPGIRINGIAPSMTDTPIAASLLSNQQKKRGKCGKAPLKVYWDT